MIGGQVWGRRRALGGLCACCGGMLGLGLLGGCASTDVAARSPDQKPLSDTDEAGLWRAMEKAEGRLAVSPRRVRDPGLEAYVTDIACRVAGSHCPNLRVYVMRAPYFNASMAPNGMMQIWSGLLLRCENEAQLAGVIAHEAGHFVERHTLENYRRLKNNTTAAMFLGIAAGPFAIVPMLLAAADLMSFSRDQERHADQLGLELMAGAGYAPDEMSKIWQNIIAEREADPHKRERDLFLATHPAEAERMATMAELAGPLKKSGQRRGADTHQTVMRPLRAEFLEDELALRQPERLLAVLGRLRLAEPEAADLAHTAGEVRRLRGAEGDAAAARKDYDTALRLDPAHAPAWRGLGLLERGLGNGGAARAAFRRYLELNPEAPDAAFLEAYVAQSS